MVKTGMIMLQHSLCLLNSDFGSCCNIDDEARRCFRKIKRAYFVYLFVRVSNQVAINMYKRLGYIVYRTVLEYYSGDPDEDAFGK